MKYFDSIRKGVSGWSHGWKHRGCWMGEVRV